VRRLLAIVLLSVTNFLLVAPAVFARAELQVPACCRAKGKHKCSMHGSLEWQSDSGLSIGTVSEKCPFSNRAGTLGSGSHPFSISRARTLAGPILIEAAVKARLEPSVHFGFDRMRQKRGPPSLLA
jgi:hypothetical protein